MKKLDGIRKKGYKTAIGVLSGTSVDAVDIVLAGIHGSASSLKVDVIDYQEYTIPQRIRSFILENSALWTGYG
ncbi:MAG: anhydro-N-acetylmuramic acid kinase [Ignavibacteria bacterium]